MIAKRERPALGRRWLWTASGRFFGYREDDQLWSRCGRHVGRFDAGDVFAPDGAYLGELHRERLVSCTKKSALSIERFEPLPAASPMTAFEGIRTISLPSGYIDFPRIKLRREPEPESIQGLTS